MLIATLLTVHAIYSARPLAGVPPSGFTWSPDGSKLIYTVIAPDTSQPPVIRIRDVRSGTDRVLLRARSNLRGSRSRPLSQIVWSPDGTRIAYLNGDELWVDQVKSGSEHEIATGADDPQWSADGTRIAYVHENDLYVATLGSDERQRLTFTGSPTRINGDPDWLYSEELDVSHAYAWSPKGDAIAYLSFDESPIAPFPIQDYLPTINSVEEQRYPLAGRANARVSLHVVELSTGQDRLLYDGAPRDEYLVSFTWSPDDRAVLDEIVDRAQQHLRLELFPRDGASSRTLWRESNSRFIDEQPAPTWLPDGRFLWLSARGGVQGVYLVGLDGEARLLTGSTPIAAILRADEHVIYAAAMAPTRRELTLLAVPLHGGAPHIVTRRRGWHAISMPEHGDEYVDAFSSVSQPPIVTIRRLNSSQEQILFSTPSLASYDLGTTRELEIPSQWGLLDAVLTVPRDFDPRHRYPVIVTAYGGPLPVGDALPSADRWQGLYTFLLAQHGFLCFSIDGPASNVDRVANERLFSKRMGRIAMAGQLAGVAWLKRQPYVDASRLGLFGWSYGGYLTSFTLTHAPGVFRSGIAGAPPADWHFYDTAYTERYMGEPQHNARAYRETSVLPAAGRLDSQLLILQGSSDDNVHLMNSISLLEAFIKAGKRVEYFLYPGARHGVAGIAAQRDLYTRMLLWWERTL